MTLSDPRWLMVVALAPLCAWVLLARVRGIPPVRRWTASALRLALLGVLALVLAGASSVRESDRLAVVAVIDGSDSVSRFCVGGIDDNGRTVPVGEAIAGVLRRLDTARGADDLLGVVTFGRRATALAIPRAEPIGAIEPLARQPEGSALAEAIELAAALIPPDAAGRIVLISDGNETSGSAVSAAERAVASGRHLRIDAVGLPQAERGETIVESLLVPSTAPPGSTVIARVEIATTTGTRGGLGVMVEGVPVDLSPGEPGETVRIDLGPGRHVVLLDLALPVTRIARLRATFEPDTASPGRFEGDTHLDNNAAEGFVLTRAPGGALIVAPGGDGNADSAALAAALEIGGIYSRTVTPEAVPVDLLELQDYDLVVLNNVPADAVGEEAQRAIAAHVAQAGAGLVMVGGRESFGSGGWMGTPIEPLLPVRLDLGERLVERRTAIVLVLDASGSMGARVGGSLRSQQEIANAAAAAAAVSLGSGDLVGVIAFASAASWVVPLGPNTEPAATEAAINGISSGGGTNLPPALELARDALVPAEAAVKHVIVLSDGRSRGAEGLPELAANLAAEGINLSTISVGDGADNDTMFRIAENGGGVHYPVTNPDILPRIFVRAVRIIRDPLIREGTITPVPLRSASPVLDGMPPLPALGGLVLTRFRDDPTVVNALATENDEPLLAHWNAGLGRVAAFTSDTGTWASAWIDSEVFEGFWVRLARTISRPGGDQGLELAAEFIGDGLTVRLSTLDDAGAPIDGLSVPATVYSPAGVRRETVLEQIGPGEYRSLVPVDDPGNHVVIVRPQREGAELRPVIGGATLSSTIEHRSLRADHALLQRVAQAGGGSFSTLEGFERIDVFDRDGVRPRRAEIPLRGPLLVLAVVLLILDVACRRVAWDRFLGDRSATIAVSTAGPDTAALLASVERARTGQRTGAQLNDTDAADVALEARRKRAAAGRSRAPVPEPTEPRPPVIEHEPQRSADAESGLLAAKRRAQERFEQGEP